jgi:hypothetical protein
MRSHTHNTLAIARSDPTLDVSDPPDWHGDPGRPDSPLGHDENITDGAVTTPGLNFQTEHRYHSRLTCQRPASAVVMTQRQGEGLSGSCKIQVTVLSDNDPRAGGLVT